MDVTLQKQLSESDRRDTPANDFDEFTKNAVEQSIPRRFEQQVAKYPKRIAVRTRTHALTYEALNEEADRVARAVLGRFESVRNEPVALLLEKGAPMIATMIGVLKTGRFQVLLDPFFPRARNAELLEDSGATLIITNDRNRTLASELAQDKCRVLNIDGQDPGATAENLPLSIPSGALAFIIYTSGSTGTPKGVMLEHRTLLHRVMRQTNSFRICADDRLSHLASFGTGQGLVNIFCALLNGAALCPLDVKDEGLGGLASWLVRERITIYRSSASTFRYFAETIGGGHDFPDLRLVRLASEQVTKRDLALCKKHFPPGCVFVNGLSTSETGIVREYFTDHETIIAGEHVPVGHAVDGMEVQLLDEQGDEVGPGEVGEIAVTSRYLSPGYWRKPELTRAAFRPDSRGREERTYLTGDMGRMLPDGLLVHVGRKDFQVKIRGHRIEVTEIELALLGHAAVKEAIVMAREDARGDQSLTAYLVADQTLRLDLRELQTFLREKLPDYMAPARYVVLDAMPLTPSGKVNRLALTANHPAAPGNMAGNVESDRVPRDGVEALLAQIWSQCLGLEDVGRDDDFFMAGGHSLLATQVVSRISSIFRVDLPLRVIFESPTVAGLAAVIEERITDELEGLSEDEARSLIGADDLGEVGKQTIKDDLLARKSSLSPAKRALFERRVRGEFACRDETRVIPKRRDQNLAPLSFAQQRLWFLNQLEPDSRAYNLRRAVRINGTLDPGAVRKTLDALVARHESLRTNFAVVDGDPVQVIADGRRVEMRVLDLSEKPKSRGEVEIEELLRSESQRPFDLSRDLLLRSTLLRLGADEHILLMMTHHIATDLSSNVILLRDFAALYESFTTGVPATLAELPIQYADFAEWQREWLRGEVLERQLSYWREQLAGRPAPLDLPFDHPRPPVQTFRGRRVYSTYPKSLLEGVKALSRREGATLFMTLLAAFQTLLHRYTGRDDIAVGSPIANRTRPEIEEVVGFFVNTLVMRTDFSGDPSFRELLRRIREVALEAYSHQDLPFEKLVEELQPERNLSHNPLFNVVVNVPNTGQPVLELPGLTLTPLEFDTGASKFDWTIFMDEVADGFRLYFEYNTDLFEPETITRALGHFQTLLEGIVADPSQKVSQPPLLTEAERRQLLIEWNDTGTEYPVNKCVHELFESQAEGTPEAVAVVAGGGERVTYGDLNRRANKLAHRLRREGVGPEVLVGVCFERTIEMVVAILGVLKAGGAYVPLDPSYPKERLAFMLEDSRAAVLLAEERLKEKLPPTTAKVISVGAERGEIDREDSDDTVCDVTPENLAYVIYTSGSTGKPKGVAIEHRNATALLDWAVKTFTKEQLSGVLASTSVCFDLSVFEIFAPLIAGGKVILAKNVLELPILPAAGEVTLVNTVPSAVVELLRISGLPESVNTINLAGEPLPQSLVRKIYQHPHVRQVFDLYGPTESTTYSTFALRAPGGRETIGRPVANTQIYILDENLLPQPVGVAGEIYIGGSGVARGYLNRADLTKEKFIRNPYDDDARGRLYATGDRARYLPDGNIEFLGRGDTQVKIRGYRVELGEIEAVLLKHHAIEQAVVVAREDADAPGGKCLVAYFVASRKLESATIEIRGYLKRKLPDYMVPSAFVSLNCLPLTPNGKVDRHALPSPEPTELEPGNFHVAPRDSTEETLAGIWAAVLKRGRIGVADNFFDLGGHSLLATQVVARVRDAFGVELPLRTLFESPTVEGLAAEITRRRAETEILLAELEGLAEEASD